MREVPYLVNVIVVDGFVKLVVEIIQELDCLSGGAATKRPKSQMFICTESVFIYCQQLDLLHLCAVSLVKPTMSPKKRVVFSYILVMTDSR